MENDFNDPVLRGMLRELADMKEQCRTVEQAIALRRSELWKGGSGRAEVPVQKGEFEGLMPVRALKNYLAKRGGGPFHIDKVGNDLVAGGLNFGKSTRTPKHHLTIIMSAKGNKDLFSYDKATGMVSLAKGPATPKPPRKATN